MHAAAAAAASPHLPSPKVSPCNVAQLEARLQQRQQHTRHAAEIGDAAEAAAAGQVHQAYWCWFCTLFEQAQPTGATPARLQQACTSYPPLGRCSQSRITVIMHTADESVLFAAVGTHTQPQHHKAAAV
jgi:hypothetical protein